MRKRVIVPEIVEPGALARREEVQHLQLIEAGARFFGTLARVLDAGVAALSAPALTWVTWSAASGRARYAAHATTDDPSRRPLTVLCGRTATSNIRLAEPSRRRCARCLTLKRRAGRN